MVSSLRKNIIRIERIFAKGSSQNLGKQLVYRLLDLICPRRTQAVESILAFLKQVATNCSITIVDQYLEPTTPEQA
jgi:hypothetical protein